MVCVAVLLKIEVSIMWCVCGSVVEVSIMWCVCVAVLLKIEVSVMWRVCGSIVEDEVSIMWRVCVCVWQRDLAEVSVDEWNNLPEVGDARNRKQRVGRTEK